MDKHIYSYLECPYCQSSFEITSINNPPQDQLIFGTARCDCDEYPIFDGILYLQKNESLKNKLAVSLLKEHKYFQTFKVLMSERKKLLWIYFFLFFLRHKKVKINKNWIGHVFKLFMLLDPPSKDWYQYCLDRKDRAIFKLCQSTLSVIRQHSIVVDCCTGMGHFLSEINQVNKPEKNLGIDYSFKLLYLARLFSTHEDNLLICSDLNNPLPLKNDSTNTIFFNDCYMYLFTQKNTIKEAIRVTKKTGLVFINHVHASGRENLGQGYSLSFPLLLRLFKDFPCYINSDRNLFKALLKHKKFVYQQLSHFSLKQNERSFSLVIKKGTAANSPKFFSISPYKKISLIGVNFTEEEDLRIS